MAEMHRGADKLLSLSSCEARCRNMPAGEDVMASHLSQATDLMTRVGEVTGTSG